MLGEVVCGEGNLGRLDAFQIWMAENTWGVPNDNAMILPEILEDARITSQRSDLIFKYQPPARRKDDGQMIYQKLPNQDM